MSRGPLPRTAPVLQPAAVAALDAIAARIVVVDVDGRVVIGNRAWHAHQPGDGSGMALGDPYSIAADVQGGADSTFITAVEELLGDVLAGRRVQADVDYRVAGAGVPRWYNVEIVPVRDQSGLSGAVVTHSDITLRKRAEDDLATLVVSDGLTGLPNRAQMESAIEELLEAPADRRNGEAPADRRNGEAPASCCRLAVLMLDLDGFKLVNDSLGHIAGDVLLLAVSHRLRAALEGDEMLSRFSSDEFSVLCPGPLRADDAVATAARLQRALAAPFEIFGAEVSVSAGVGVALDTGPSCSAEDLLGDADAAMHRAKQRGYGHIEVADEQLRRHALDRLQTTAALHQALQRDQLRLHYQPVVELATGRVIGAEALLRWVHPTRGLLIAADFIDVVEHTGLIVPVGRWVLAQVCQHLHRWQTDHPQVPVKIGFNLSPRQLADSALVSSLEQAVRESGCDPTGLVVEITESVLFHDTGASVEALERITAMGASLSIDDFGTGYSSLKRLQELTVQGIKIDRSFVAGIGDGGRDRVIVEATISLARALGIRVTAEGVETCAQARHLADTGVQGAQGWLWSNAVSPEQFGALLGRRAQLPPRDTSGALARPSPPPGA